jgi:anti-sigma B factor antagonist
MAKLTIREEKLSAGTVITLAGSLDIDTASQFASKIDAVLESGVKIIVCNVNELSYIASAGLGVMISANETLKKRDGALKLSQMNEKILKIFTILGFNTLFDMYNSDKEALSG